MFKPSLVEDGWSPLGTRSDTWSPQQQQQEDRFVHLDHPSADKIVGGGKGRSNDPLILIMHKRGRGGATMII